MFEADVNQLPANELGCPSSPATPDLCRPFPQYTGIGVGAGGSRTGLYKGVSNYEAVQGLLHKPFGNGLSAELAYTWSRLKDDMDTSGWGNQFGGVFYQDACNPHANYGLSNFDRPHAFKATAAYALPLGKSARMMFSGGPSIFKTKLDVVRSLEFSILPGFTSLGLDRTLITRDKQTVAGFNAGADLTWTLASHLGVGILTRYSRAHVTLDPGAASGMSRAIEMHAGGLDLGGGIRLLF